MARQGSRRGIVHRLHGTGRGLSCGQASAAEGGSGTARTAPWIGPGAAPGEGFPTEGWCATETEPVREATGRRTA
jgi:hypothetical protein